MPDELTLLLDAYAANTLRDMAEANDIAITTAAGKKLPKEMLLAKLRQEFFSSERIWASYRRLSRVERAVFDRLLLHGGKMPTRRFKNELIRASLALEAPEPKQRYGYYSDAPYADGYAGSPSRADSKIFEDIIARLTYRGLVFSQDPELVAGNNPYKLRFHPAVELYIPAVIRETLPKPDPLPTPMAGWEPKTALRGDAALLLRDLYLYWDFVRRNDVSLLTTGLVGKRSLKMINAMLLVPEPMLDSARREDEAAGRLYLLRRLLQALGLLHAQQGRLQSTTKNPVDIPDFWRQPQAEQVRACLTHWTQLAQFTDTIDDKLTQYGANFVSARQTILKAILSLPVDRWLEIDELLAQAQAENVNFLFPDRRAVESSRRSGSYYSRYSTRTFYGPPQQLLTTFDRLEAAFVVACLSGMLFQLGLVELGSDQAELPAGAGAKWSAFRLTEAGQMILRHQPAASAPQHQGKLLVQPNFQVVAMGPVGLEVLARLDLFAEREQADRGAFQYRLSRPSIYQAQQLGLTVAEIIEFLNRASQAELPQNVLRSLEEWAGRYERIVFRQGISLLQAADAALLNRLLVAPDTGALLARAVADDVALIKSGQQAKLVGQLMAQELLPAMDGNNPQAANQSVQVQADGTIEPVQAVPSLYLRGRLESLAEPTGEGRWRLTPASVRRAGGSRSKVLRLLAELEQLHRGRLPASIISRLKGWGGYYGQAAAETLTLIEFSDQEILTELLAQPDLQEKLTPFTAGNRALAIVAPGQLPQVQAILAGLGVTIKERLSR